MGIHFEVTVTGCVTTGWVTTHRGSLLLLGLPGGLPALISCSQHQCGSSGNTASTTHAVAGPMRASVQYRTPNSCKRGRSTVLHATAELKNDEHAAARSMPRRRLGRTSLEVPVLCFGTMLFGESASYGEAQKLLDQCWEAGIDFFDSAEMYPVPQQAETWGDSERMLGCWMKTKPRDRVLVSTKVCGPSGQMTWIRGGPHCVDPHNIAQAIEGSLQRLGTDYIDILHIHWPDRYVPMFGDVDYDPVLSYTSVPLEDQLLALGKAQDQGKVRLVALSNETPYGLTRALMAAKYSGGTQLPLPRVEALQNALNLTCRTFDSGLAEVCHQEQVSLLAYSPLAMGWLTGKYLSPGGGPPEARLNKYKGRYSEAESRYGPRPAVVAAVRAYCRIAEEAGMSPTELALRWVVHHPLVTSAVIGATSCAQLQEQITAATQPPLPQDVLAAIDSVHQQYPSPTP